MRRKLREGIIELIYYMAFFMILFLCASKLYAASIPGYYGSITPPSKTELPSLKTIVQGVESITQPSASSLVINQNLSKAIIDWNSFNIGENASVYFNQQGNSSWVALNRIWSNDPSKIYGSLTADGKVYLINQNGILFGPNSRINVNTLVASTLNITQQNFLNDVMAFKLEDYQGTGGGISQAVVSNHGVIKAANEGAVYLISPNVENYGTIAAPYGQIGLIAGTDVALDLSGTDTYLRFGDEKTLMKQVQMSAGFGEVLNAGTLSADYGLTGLYGGTIRHNGIIRSVTSVHTAGRVELVARDRVETGVGSIIDLPVSAAAEVVKYSDDCYRGTVSLHGWSQQAPVDYITHRGAINAPGGGVYLLGGKRVYLDTGSSIDVSGVWSDKSAADAILSVQLGSAELADSYAQKSTAKGETVTALLYQASSSNLGDLTNYIKNRDLTNTERLMDGGLIQISAIPASGTGEIIAREGSYLGFAGGGVRYSGGYANLTKVLIGNKIYSISSSILDKVTAQEILGSYTKKYERFGVSESYSGMYYGGTSPLIDYVDPYVTGGNAGVLNLAAGTIVLEGSINGSVTRGIYQNTRSTTFDPDIQMKISGYDVLLSVADGTEVPHAGAVQIGVLNSALSNITYSNGALVNSVSIVGDKTPLSSSFTETTFLTTSDTVLSARMLNEAGLGTITLDNVATSIKVGSDSALTLQAGGSFSANARRIENAGTITVPGGTISLTLTDNANTEPLDIQRRIVLLPGSVLSVSGEIQDNTSGMSSIYTPLTTGGTVKLWDHTYYGDGVFIFDGATVDVSGGYTISSSGTASGGSAGTLAIEGSTIFLGGNLKGYALADSTGKTKGGTISLHALSVDIVKTAQNWPTGITATSELPASVQGLVLDDDRLDNTGFTNIVIKSLTDLTVESGVVLTPSLVRLKDPSPGVLQSVTAATACSYSGGTAVAGHSDLIRLDSDYAASAGKSSLTLAAGANFTNADSTQYDGFMRSTYSDISVNPDASLSVRPGTVISVLPQGGITMSASGDVAIAGLIKALGGKVGITSTAGSVRLTNGGEIDASGYLETDRSTILSGYVLNSNPIAGGNITLKAYEDIILEPGSLIDISGSESSRNWLKTADSDILWIKEAGKAGSLTLDFRDGLTWAGNVQAHSSLASVAGGTLTIKQVSSDISSNVSGLIFSASDLQRYVASGFEDVTLWSSKSIGFSESVTAAFKQKLTLNSPEIKGASGASVDFSAPWIVLTNTSFSTTAGTTAAGSASLALKGDWVDVNGAIGLNGFDSLRLDATRDIRLDEGILSLAGDISLKAGRIYPLTYSDFTLNASGKVIVLPADRKVGGLIYSAGGTITIEGDEGIEVWGTLAAPLGVIALNASGKRIYLAEGSVLTTAGSGASVNYGSLDANNVWTNAGSKTVDETLADSLSKSGSTKGVSLSGGEVIVGNGARIDVSGGGSISAFAFRSDVSGTTNPLTKSGRYIVFADQSLSLPGTAVYLTGGGGLAAGYYTLINASEHPEYAFLSGAYILEVRSSSLVPTSSTRTADGYALTIGYTGVTGTSILSSRPTYYVVRTAADVLTEGSFDKATLTSGNGGKLSIVGTTTVLEGKISGQALAGYQGGTATLAAAQVLVGANAVSLPASFNWSTPLPDELKEKLSITAESLSGSGFGEIVLGDASVTDTVTICSGVALDVAALTMIANTAILVESGAQITAAAQNGNGTGIVTFAGPTTIEAGASVHAARGITVDGVFNLAGDWKNSGKLTIDDGSFTIKGADIYFVADGITGTGATYVTHTAWDLFDDFKNISFVSSRDIVFQDDFDLTVSGNLTLDAARILGYTTYNQTNNTGFGAVNINVAASTLTLQNSRNASTLAAPTANTSTFTASGNAITLGSGYVQFGGFNALQLSAQGDITMIGTGSLSTGGASLALSAARAKTALSNKSSGDYQAASFFLYTGSNYTLDKDSSSGLAPSGKVLITGNGSSWDENDKASGALEIWGTSIDQAGALDVGAGQIRLAATGTGVNDGIYLRNGSRILARGTESAAGGRVVLQSPSGQIMMEEGAVINVSNNGGGAGYISIYGPEKTVNIRGNLLAGSGGSFSLDTLSLSSIDLAALAGKLSAEGFTDKIDLRVRTGDLLVAEGTTLKANKVVLTADGDNLGVYGTIDASGSNGGGRVELYAQNDLNIGNGGLIDASATAEDVDGGYVLLSSAAGTVTLNGGTLDLSGSGGGTGGTLYLRALRNGSDVKIDISDGSINGSAAVYAEAVKVYAYAGDKTIYSNLISTYNSETCDYMTGNTAFARLSGQLGAISADLGNTLAFMPGIEVRSTGNLTLGATFWTPTSTTSGWRYTNDAPGVLTLRAAGDLNINASLVDRATSSASLDSTTAKNTWGYNLIAGADSAGANYLSVNEASTGNLAIGDGIVVYTEKAPIRFASAGDTTIGSGPATAPNYMLGTGTTSTTMNSSRYNLATYAGDIEGTVGGTLTIRGGAIQTATGDIDLIVGEDLLLSTATVSSFSTLGAIRTTGENPSNHKLYYQYSGGGDIDIDVWGTVAKKTIANDGSVTLGVATTETAWDKAYGKNNSSTKPPYYWGAVFERTTAYPGGTNYVVDTTSGFATLGGGNLRIRAGGDFWAQVGTFGQVDSGDLTIQSGGSLLGQFLNVKGDTVITAAVNAGSSTRALAINLGDSVASLTAGGDAVIGIIADPNLSNRWMVNVGSWDPLYTQDTSIRIEAGGGVTLTGDNPYVTPISGTNTATYMQNAQKMLPATVFIEAYDGDILIQKDFVVMPSKMGNLTLKADKGSFDGSTGTGMAKIILSDFDPNSIYTRLEYTTEPYTTLVDPSKHASTPIHEGDTNSVMIEAGQDVKNIIFVFPKSVEIIAGRNISNMTYYGQNISKSDVSLIRAGGDISFVTAAAVAAANATQDIVIQQGGPGILIVQAGGNVDLGTSLGIQVVGQGTNSALDPSGCDLIVASGYLKSWSRETVADFFSQLKAASRRYSELLLSSKAEATAFLQKTRTELIEANLGVSTGTSNVSLLSTQIANDTPNGSIYMLVDGILDVGKTAFLNDNKTKGITTTAGGQIGIFAVGDINVNESRLMTFLGGDITVWSDGGNINAGRGSKAQMNFSPPTYTWDESAKKYTKTFTPPSAGSGIRCTTGDPDGAGPNGAPAAGDIYLTAPGGIIDAGEAGISGNNVFLGGEQVINASNISSITGTIGAPQTQTSSVSLGSLSGAGALAAQSKSGELAAAGSLNSRSVGQMVEGIMAKWLDVKVISFEE